MGLLTDKIVILVGMFFATICCGIVPLALVARSLNAANSAKWKKALSLMTCFSGGVFIAACLLDLFPDVEEAINNVLVEVDNSYGIQITYPVAQFVIVAGFFMVLFIEQMVLTYQGNAQIMGHGHSHLPATPTSETETRPLIDEGPENGTNHGTFSEPNEDALNTSADVAVVISDPEEHTHSDDHALEHSSLRSIILCVALSFHSLFEGLAIGLQETTGQLFSIFLAVIVHKGIMAFSLGLNLAQSNLNRKHFFLSVFIFSIASPLGIAIGIALTDMNQSLTRDICNGILQGLAGGTFLYITFFEVLPQELKSHNYRMLRFLFVLLGYLCICGLLIVAG